MLRRSIEGAKILGDSILDGFGFGLPDLIQAISGGRTLERDADEKRLRHVMVSGRIAGNLAQVVLLSVLFGPAGFVVGYAGGGLLQWSVIRGKPRQIDINRNP